MQGVAIQTVLGSSLFEQNYPLMKKVLNGENQQFERPMKKQDGSIVDSLVSYITDRDEKGNINGFFAVVSDISGLREADAAIRLSASVFEATTESIAVMDEAWNIVSTNKAFSNLTGYSPEEIKGQSVNILKSTGNDKDFFRSVNRQIEARKVWKGEVWCKRKDGSILLTRLSITAILTKDNVVSSYVAMSADITKQRKAERRMQFMSLHDGLTGLPNRSLLMERIAQLIAISARESRHIALLFLDLDGFKQVNDTWGHATGDKVLKAVATRLLSLVRPSDTIARIGGDEFVILLDNPESIDNVAMIAARVIDSVNMPIMVDEQISHIGTSIGISFFREDNATPEDLLKRADAAMYKAKAVGKNTYQFSD
jgi:diguanylate cyclase (GGDEF)-like protein/PAS domain S-box-containing protein